MKIEKSVTEILSLLEESNPNGKFERVPVFLNPLLEVIFLFQN